MPAWGELAEQPAGALHAPERLDAVARQVLDRVGGPLWEGYEVTDPRTPS